MSSSLTLPADEAMVAPVVLCSIIVRDRRPSTFWISAAWAALAPVPLTLALKWTWRYCWAPTEAKAPFKVFWTDVPHAARPREATTITATSFVRRAAMTPDFSLLIPKLTDDGFLVRHDATGRSPR